VNCLQFFIFTRFFAVFGNTYGISLQLWIAYNFLSLQGSLQLIVLNCQQNRCCELLTIFYLYKVLCSYFLKFVWLPCVVNCLQFFIFTRFFAVWLRYDNHKRWVVNCLQFFIFTRFFAVISSDEFKPELLWIAYNFLSLQGSLQSTIPSPFIPASCELLTIFYLYKVLCSFE